MNDNRRQFEIWAQSNGYGLTRTEAMPHIYVSQHTRDAWEAWQAARSFGSTITEEQSK